MTQAELARHAVLTTSIVAGYESGLMTPRPANLKAIREALEKAGIEFIDRDRPVW
jgi:predicted transcriptional regulator